MCNLDFAHEFTQHSLTHASNILVMQIANQLRQSERVCVCACACEEREKADIYIYIYRRKIEKSTRTALGSLRMRKSPLRKFGRYSNRSMSGTEFNTDSQLTIN